MVSINKIKNQEQIENVVYLLPKDFVFASILDEKSAEYVSARVAQDKDFVHLNLLDKQIYIVLNPEKKFEWQTTEYIRRKASDIWHSLQTLNIQNITFIDYSNSNILGLAFLEGFYLSSYQFIPYFRDSEKKQFVDVVVNYYGQLAENLIQEHVVLWNAVFQTKSLVNEPIISLSAPQYVEKIKTIAAEKGISATIYDKSWIESQAMGGILAVNKGSIDPPYFCVLEWKPETYINQKPLVLIGKGIMYDTGGLSLKTSAGMETMKADMSGSAAVLGTITAVATNKLPIHLLVIIPLTDNRPGGNAYAPGDIIKMHNGLFVEVLNTDAEGRMILADALSYAKNFDPELVIDIATLTGSANAAVGEHAAVVMGTAAEKNIQTLINSGFETFERLVQFPMWDDYADQIKSDFADLKNVGGPLAGAITAGKFLEYFTSYPWIHIDIAGSAYHPKGSGYKGKGATAMGVRLLYSFIKTYISA